MKFAVGIGAFIGGLLSVLVLVLVMRAFDHDAVLVFGTADGKSIDVLAGVILPLVSTFAGAAAGSFCTYLFQVKNQRVEQESQEVTLVRQVFLALESQLSDLGGLKKVMVLPHSKDKLRFLNMPSAIGYTGVSERVNHDISLPLIRYRRVETLQRVRLAEKGYLNVIAVHQSYNELSAAYKKALREGGVNLNDICTFRFKTALVGGEAIAQMYVVGESLVELMDSAISDISQVLAELSSFYTENYKNAEHRMIVSVPLDSADEIFAKSEPPYFSDLDEVMEASGYEPKYFDPATNDPRPSRRLAKLSWLSSDYKSPTRCRYRLHPLT